MKRFATITKWLGIAVYTACAVLIVLFLTPIGGWKALDVLTGSMKPTIQPGDLVLIHRVHMTEIRPGDIITYTNPADPRQTITHRVQSKPVIGGVQMIVTKGDANATADRPFPAGRVVGKVVGHVPMIGRLINWLHNPYGLAALVIIPGLIVIWAEIRNLRRALAMPKDRGARPADDSEPPQDEPPTGPSSDDRLRPAPTARATPQTVPAGPHPVPPARPRRGLDGMRPRSMALMLVGFLVLAAVGPTYALTTNNVAATGIRFTAIGTPRPNPLNIALTALKRALQAAATQFSLDTRTCLAAARPNFNPVAPFDNITPQLLATTTDIPAALSAQVTQPDLARQGPVSYSAAFDTASSHAAALTATSQNQATANLSPAPPATSLAQCLKDASNRYQTAIKAARDQFLIAIGVYNHNH